MGRVFLVGESAGGTIAVRARAKGTADWLKPRGVGYYEILKRSGYGGTVEFVETEGESHCFHVFNPTCEKALALNRALASFINQD
ncbi:hypothetical protein RJ640_016531 [Escallonia rubra]|uniref:Alpha/beta hydrolase fold-3 domain-containing protein n=1 Tax=Escallonia rubra TaxID=112253 RepID=A0AA88S3Q2_9ASTE|nr:hypothetical protein RJ640_016531 [Escallonia rubra]